MRRLVQAHQDRADRDPAGGDPDHVVADVGGVQVRHHQQVGAAGVIGAVAFHELQRAMHAAGCRTFVEVGPGSVLTGLVGRILGDVPHSAIALDRKGKDGEEALVQSLALRYQEPASGGWSPVWPPPGVPLNTLPSTLLPGAVALQIDGAQPAWPPLVVPQRAAEHQHEQRQEGQSDQDFDQREAVAVKHPPESLRAFPPLLREGGQRQWPAQVRPRRSPCGLLRGLSALSFHALRVVGQRHEQPR